MAAGAIRRRPARVRRCTVTDADEIGRAQPAAAPRRAAGRQHVVRSGGVVAGGLRAVGADEHRAGARSGVAATALGRRTTRCSGAMRWRARSPRARVRVTTMPPLAASACRAGPSAGICSTTCARDCGGEPARRRQEHRARVGIVLGLRDEVGGNPRRVARQPRRPRSRSGRRGSRSRSRARQRLRRRDVARCPARRSCPRAESCACRRRAPRSACAPPRRNSRVTPALRARAMTVGVGPRADGDDLRDARDARRDRGHQQRRRQRIAAAGNVAADAVEREDALLDADARRRLRPPSRAGPARGDAAMCRAAVAMARSHRRRHRRARRGGSPRADTSIGPIEPSNCRAYASSAGRRRGARPRRSCATRRSSAASRRLARSSSDATAALRRSRIIIRTIDSRC